MSKIQISASIVLYHNARKQIEKVINCFFNTKMVVKLYLVDNSMNRDLEVLKEGDFPIEYIYNNKNVGYGTAHNIAIKKSIEEGVNYHVVLNPDISFSEGVLESLYEYMEMDRDIGNIVPQIKYPNGEIQHLCKLLPTPVDLIFRRFLPFKKWKSRRDEKYELRRSSYNRVMNIPSLSGCFMFLRTSSMKEVGLFDENFFMYLEDTDLNRRIHTKFKTIFYPNAEITHEYAKESYKNRKLLKYHINSAIYYFNKWGWLIDLERDKINKECLKRIEDLNN